MSASHFIGVGDADLSHNLGQSGAFFKNRASATLSLSLRLKRHAKISREAEWSNFFDDSATRAKSFAFAILQLISDKRALQSYRDSIKILRPLQFSRSHQSRSTDDLFEEYVRE